MILSFFLPFFFILSFLNALAFHFYLLLLLFFSLFAR